MAKENAGNPDMIICPCGSCRNLSQQHCDTVLEHLVMKGMDPRYKSWVLHGEPLSESIEVQENAAIPETYRMFRDVYVQDDFSQPTNESREREFTQALEDVETPLYPGCTKYTKFSAIVALYKQKVVHEASDKSFDELLRIVSDMLPEGNTLVQSIYTTKKLLKAFDLGYDKIHACVNDCCLFRKELEHMETYPKCNCSRWKVDKRTKKIKKGVPAKVLRYFPIIPRFRRMFRSQVKAEQLTWHSTHKSQDGKMRHPVDSLAWDSIDQKWPSFTLDPRNLRLDLATDGFNPFANLSSRYSCWPVMLATYNLPPWLCMAKENIMLTLLIPGPKQPGNDIDVYLQPLIEDLQELWNNGVEVYDAANKSMFNLKAMLMWTINDFPANGNLAGCATKGKVACPICSINTCSQWLNHSKKIVYMGHRRFLSADYPFLMKRSWFDGKQELRGNSKPLSGSDVLDAIKDIETNWGKTTKERKRKRDQTKQKKDQKEFDCALLLRHNLDLMHIEKNVCESILCTLLNVKGKSKDGLKARKDLAKMGIRSELHAEDKGSHFYLPPASHTLSKDEKKIFCSRLQDLKLPDGYSSNIANCVSVQECKLIGLKSHDCHVLFQQLLSVALRGLLPKGPRNAIFRLCSFFNQLCQKVIDRNMIEQLENDVAETLCILERFFPPSFFDIMVHLTIHLGREARLCGPVQFR
ncbi:uncharacterized protein LOC114309428 [Camellia sinensis]|uniref:uncharacterized protein LOC114309428 n=1 Tax=Camellia sinensis TaxID=4442 RepID=UPI00103570E3|nr:uncharacterized protein LOC114309428 [Camellia sinensis]